MKHILSASQFADRKILENLFQLTNKIEKNGAKGNELRGKILTSLFYEPSTRTRLSFEAAMLKLGGAVISTENASQFSSAAKGETLEDTVRVVAGYSDVIILRHPEQGASERAAAVSAVPIISAGDGSGEHPTQALLDVYTIKQEKGKIEGLTVALAGDLLYGRTVHSLAQLLAVFSGVKILFVSPQELKMPENYLSILKEKKVSFEETSDLDKVLPASDVLYITRVQKERFPSKEAYEKVAGAYVINEVSLSKMKKDAAIMHPFPRVSEISPDVDKDKRAAYFRQAKNGLYVRMALLQTLLSGSSIAR